MQYRRDGYRWIVSFLYAELNSVCEKESSGWIEVVNCETVLIRTFPSGLFCIIWNRSGSRIHGHMLLCKCYCIPGVYSCELQSNRGGCRLSTVPYLPPITSDSFLVSFMFDSCVVNSTESETSPFYVVKRTS